MATRKKSNNNVGKAIAIGAGIAALSAGAYLLFGPNGKKNQKKAKAWMVKMKKDVVKKMKEVKNVSGPVFHKIVEDVSSEYKKMKNVDSAELRAMAGAMKQEWKAASERVVKKASGRVKTAAKKIVKSVKKTASKKR